MSDGSVKVETKHEAPNPDGTTTVTVTTETVIPPGGGDNDDDSIGG